MLENLNPYDENKFREWFVNTSIYESINRDSDKISWKKYIQDTFLDGDTRSIEEHPGMTPRQFMTTRLSTVVSFYYLNYLLDAKPEFIYDIGCGVNWFKKYIPNVIGIGNEPIGNPFYGGDIQGTFDEKFVEANREKFESVFSIDSIHFVSITKINDRIKSIVDILKPGGRAYVSLNFARLMDNTSAEEFDSLFPAGKNNQLIEDYIRKTINLGEHLPLCIDIDCQTCYDEFMDGNIRIVFEKAK